jgi:exodeoxyribonuclease VII small subunit
MVKAAKSSDVMNSGNNFEASLAALEKIVRDLENGDLPLDESLKLFEQGIGLYRQCQERLNQAERRIEVLLRDSEGNPIVESLTDKNLSKAEPEPTKSKTSLCFQR